MSSLPPPGSLLDTGPLVALLDKSDQSHLKAVHLFSKISPPLRTCEAVLTEACYLISKSHPRGAQELLNLGMKGIYHIPFKLEEHPSAVQTLLQKYQDQPISLADACLIRMAELYEEPRILTFDSDFETYRWGRNRKFLILE